MLIVPLTAVASQKVTISLANQTCQLFVYQKSTGLFMDVEVSNSLIIGGVLCEDRNRIVRDLYLGFIGDFSFIDTQGTQDPDYTGLGERYVLAYLETTDLPAGQG